MDIIVLVSETVDTEEDIVIEDKGLVDHDGLTHILNPYDEYAVEEAMLLKESFGGTVTALTVGPQQSEEILRHVLALGVDQVVRIDPGERFLDAYVVATCLAQAIRKYPFDILLAGNVSIDYGSGQVGPRVAETLGIPCAVAAVNIKIEQNQAVVIRELDGRDDTLQMPLPCLITAQQGLNEPRYATLQGMIKAKKKPITTVSANDLLEGSGDLQPQITVVRQFQPAKRGETRIFSGEPDQQVQELLPLLDTNQ
ncbi:electron transfer flavoprotein beta subunit/FixA family protein [Sporolactobacillus sp. THM7-7]|nr:electron transfer flavoprotein beta subunit/FixA family protein [Sporolactobacillus sp. THM7-7]